ncbi:uncharacterized protein BDR25DRAFT_272389 [Lindgomyces ingoldianus]|uniref:Uncharacterized protein n=1 Tax=Lindgomyces ingoldianus TaxID=673940 RepID=A0ACB6QCJ8_9PLEO|nr:uncharacterized protein BDR25DRAFT_272389 [Lindgomyces ingoldianus]KAF2463866.1 hypothetical protein BDR25DRAFT_272389 [Lindgomyces ingoldianus]
MDAFAGASEDGTSAPRIEFPLRPRAPKGVQEERKGFTPRRSHQDLKKAGKSPEFVGQKQHQERDNPWKSSPDRLSVDYGILNLRIRDEETPRSPSPRFSLQKSAFATTAVQFPPQRLHRALSPVPATSPDTISNIRSSTLQSPQTEPVAPTILIGIDFGTTHSGVAWAYSKQPDDIKIVTNWDSFEWGNSDKGKAPTAISYGAPVSDAGVAENSGANTPKEILWGYGMGDAESVKWFKLLLLDEEDMEDAQRNSVQIKRARELLRHADKTPIQAVADYLRLLWNHALTNINKDFGKVAVDGTPFRVVLTVPAVWTTKAKDRMTKAAKRAGILDVRLAGETVLNFVSEPEAAALATFQDLKARPNFQTRDTFVVCDAGGGTVDLISYQVLDTNPLQLKECVEGSGKLCGAIFLDQDFEDLMSQLVGDAWNVPEGDKRELMSAQWENGIKRSFEGQDRAWRVTLPHACYQRGAPPSLQLEKGFVEDIFDNVISQIRALVNDQISAVEKKSGHLPKAVVLVGGLGSCRYLFKKLNEENEPRDIRVQQSQGDKPWTTICRGAVLKALTNTQLPGVTVYSRISRHSYGIEHNTDFDPTRHREDEKFTDEVTGTERVKHEMTWYLKRGDDIEETKPVKLGWHKHISADYGSTYSFAVDISLCGELTPPKRYNNTVRSSCTLKADLDISHIPIIQGFDGNRYKRAHFDIEMTVIGTALDFALFVQGKRINHSQVETEFED